ncbi:MAG: hypothetical protein LBQ39_07065 [Tannerellaceae bacterium]|jgi:hypothetical protein|nr:hypothetical protein [Tannerellaceae bacterium]
MKDNDLINFILEEIVKAANNGGYHHISGLLESYDASLRDNSGLRHKIMTRMVDEGIAKRLDSDRLYPNNLSYTIVANGGYLTYLSHQNQKREQEQKQLLLEQKNLSLNVKQNEWLYKTRWWPLIISIAALIVSVIALL